MDISARLVLIRGVPGQGKSTLAKAFVGYEHVENDMYPGYYIDGKYTWSMEANRKASEWCRAEARRLLSEGKWVVVSNTFCWKGSMDPYRKIATELRVRVAVIEARGFFKSVHDVSESGMNFYRNRFEP
jgi:predicted kinase